MVVINMFALHYFSGCLKILSGDEVSNKKDEEKADKLVDPSK